jgi:hypothetical protein
MPNPGAELANHVVPALTPKVAAPGGGVVVVVVELDGTDVVLDGGSVVVTTGQRQSPPQVPPPGQATPAGSQVSPCDAVTTPSPHRAAQSVPASAQHERHVRLKAMHARRAARMIAPAFRRHRRRSGPRPVQAARSVGPSPFASATHAAFPATQLRAHVRSTEAASARKVTQASSSTAIARAVCTAGR